MIEISNFLPDWASPPGATIRDLLEERGQTVADFARAIGDSVDNAQRLLKGTAHITDQVANRLAEVLGTPAAFWLSRETQFRDSLARQASNEQLLKELPIGNMIKYGWIQATRNANDRLAACLKFFDVPTISDWRERYEGGARLAAFRTSESFDSDEGAVVAWLRKGEIDADGIQCEDWNPDLLRSLLPSLRALTRQKNPSIFIPELQRIGAACGIAIVIARVPKGCRASGATRFIAPNKALLMLSFRHLSDDHFWFTFFHEVGHLLLHDARELFLEGGNLCTGEEEREANEFSSNLLVPPEHQAAMRALPLDSRAVMRFSRDIGVSPGVVVGQLQYFGILTHRQLNQLKERYSWIEN